MHVTTRSPSPSSNRLVAHQSTQSISRNRDRARSVQEAILDRMAITRRVCWNGQAKSAQVLSRKMSGALKQSLLVVVDRGVLSVDAVVTRG